MGKFGPEKTPYLDSFHTVPLIEIDMSTGTIRSIFLEVLSKNDVLNFNPLLHNVEKWPNIL